MTANKTHCADRKEKDMEKPEFTAKALDYTALCDYLGALCDCYGFVHTEYIGETILTRPIPCAVLGEGKTDSIHLGMIGEQTENAGAVFPFFFHVSGAVKGSFPLSGV